MKLILITFELLIGFSELNANANLTNSQLKAVIDHCSALDTRTQQESFDLAWHTLKTHAESSHFSNRSAGAINGMGKLIADCDFTLTGELIDSFLNIGFNYLDSLINNNDPVIDQKFRSHARIWKALIIMRNHNIILNYALQDAWDLLLKSNSDGATKSSLLWAAELILKYNFNPNEISRLESLELTKVLLNMIGSSEHTIRLQHHLNQAQIILSSQLSSSTQNEFRCEYINNIENKEQYKALCQEVNKQIAELNALPNTGITSPAGNESIQTNTVNESSLCSSESSESKSEEDSFEQGSESRSNITSEDEHTGSESESDSELMSNSESIQSENLTNFNRTSTSECTFICPYTNCRRSFAWLSSLKVHESTHTGERPFSCQECGKAFKLNRHLIDHSVVHREERPFACHTCGKAFKVRYRLKEHMRVHTGERPFVCDICGKAFRQASGISHHRRLHLQ